MRCPANGCEIVTPPEMLMCRSHWYMVPKALRSEVWRAWKARLRAMEDGPDRGEARERHEHVKAEAIRAVNERLAS